MDITERIKKLVGMGKSPAEAEKIAQDEAQALDLPEVDAAVGDAVREYQDGSAHDRGIDGSRSAW